MQTSAIIALCLGVLLLGLAGVFFILLFFFKKGKREDDDARQWQQHMMSRIDDVFPNIERLLRDGISVPTPVAASASAAEDYSRHQDDADAALQRELEQSNNISDAERAAKTEPTLFDGGGFVC